MKYNCLLWLFIFTVSFGYCHPSAVNTTTLYIITIWKTFGGVINISIVNLLFCVGCSFILMSKVWIHLINFIISFLFISWPVLIGCDLSENDLGFNIFLDINSFNWNCIINVDIHISQPHFTLWWLIVFLSDETYIFLLHLRLILRLRNILLHENYPLVVVLLSHCGFLSSIFS